MTAGNAQRVRKIGFHAGMWQCIRCRLPLPTANISERAQPRKSKQNNCNARCNDCKAEGNVERIQAASVVDVARKRKGVGL